MQDGVADILTERRALDRNRLPGGVAASAVVHFLIAFAVILAARAKSREPVRPVVTVRLASPASFGRPEVSSPSKPAQPKAQEKPAEPPPESKKKAPEENLFGRSKEAPQAKDAKPAPAPAPADSAPVPPVAAAGGGGSPGGAPGNLPSIGATGVTGLEGGDFPYTLYLERMLTLVGSHWFRPGTSGQPTASVYFVIERDGRISDAKIEKSSGSGVFDRAAIRAVIESSPLPPLPFGYSGTFLGVHLTFH